MVATEILRALRDLLDQVESLEGYTVSRDLEPHEAEACWEDAQAYARAVIGKAVPQ